MTKLALVRFTEILEVEYGKKGILAIAFHPGGVRTDMALQMEDKFSSILTETPELAGDFTVWLTGERREWLNGRYLNCKWDVMELVAIKDEIVDGDKLKVKMVV